MKQLQVQDQVRLGPMRCMTLTIAGIRFRLFRSMITVVILALAVAFLAHGLGHALITHEARYEASQRLDALRLSGQWSSRLSKPDGRQQIRARLATGRMPFVEEYARWAGAGEAESEQMQSIASQLSQYIAFFEALPDAKRVIVLEGKEPFEGIQSLGRPNAVSRMSERLASLSLAEPEDGGVEALGAFVRGPMKELAGYVDRVITGQRRAIESVREAAGDQGLLAWLAADAKAVREKLSAAGFTIDAATAQRLASGAGHDFMLALLDTSLANPEMAASVIRETGLDPKTLTIERVVAWITRQSRAQWLVEEIGRTHTDAKFKALTATSLLEAAERFRQREALKRLAGEDAVEARQGLFDLPVTTRWLMVLSFLVCAVGVTNAMFMSVTERFTEIATMKCLGALDGFLMLTFLFESGIQGLVGAVAGMVVGLLIAILRGFFSYGGLALTATPWGDLTMCGGLAFVVGVLLSVAAGVGPAFIVARLAPMEAMRIE